ncbi:hypothetical protein Bca52824_001560 [Brassica carinata]|uniref:UDP-glucuronate 4-epimerase n=1 Tax=Brassica carinata TaxID=52824 RepID=A0A8X7WJM0_BRACI|nr:hypothetical protein Bca52824_001560 [Brassica carinata]
MSHLDDLPSTPGKYKTDKALPYGILHHHRYLRLSKPTLWASLFLALFFFYLLLSPPLTPSRRNLNDSSSLSAKYGGSNWEKQVRKSAHPRSRGRLTVLDLGAAEFVGTHVSIAFQRRGDGVLGLDNFSRYYDPKLKRARQGLLDRSGVFVVEGDINDAVLLKKLYDIVLFRHMMHLAAQAGVRYAMQNPGSYVNRNIAGFVNLLEVSKGANPQPAVVWASSSSVYDRTDHPASLYAATKKAGEVIAHTYNHIYGLSLTGLRFFTVYGPWGRPDMAYFFFTKDILRGKTITVFESPDKGIVARDFTYIDDIVKVCLGPLDTAEKSTGSGGKKRGPAMFRIYNLGNTSPVPVNKLVKILEKLLKMKAKKKVMPLPRYGVVEFTHANITLAQSEIGYKPAVDLETGLKKFVKWYLGFYSGSKKKSSW